MHRIHFQSNGQDVTFAIEKAITPQQKMRGLMHRKSLEKDAGMLFVFKKPQIIRMWMKDTIIPLDMVFIRNNQVVSIFQNAQPMDTRTISSHVLADSVLEINAGSVKKYHINVGDKIRF
jgi:uncharacterized membrane protein (UPF0127 family)